MSIGLIGKKIGMSRVFTETGESIPVTLVKVSENRITQIKNALTDGYNAIQVTQDHQNASRINKAKKGHFKKAESGAGRGLFEFRCSEPELTNYKLGQEIVAQDVIKVGDVVDVQGTSIGKGFAGTIKRYNFSMQDATHGNSLSHRAPGSTGQNQSPGRVFKGKKMAGQMGNVTKTIQNLEVISYDQDESLYAIKGSIPGHDNGIVRITKAIKKIIKG